MKRINKNTRSKLNSKERAALRGMDEMDDVRHNWKRRFNNALLCLARCDPRWMLWVDRELDTEKMRLEEMTRLIEARARTLVLKPFRYFDSKYIGGLIFRDDWCFTDRGNLGPG